MACLNDGKCLPSGSCECKKEFSGITCSNNAESEYSLFLTF